jgi:hypothetical protein
VSAVETPADQDTTTAVYVYGVVPADTAPELFANVGGVDSAHPVVLLVEEGLAAIASAVPLAEFGADAIEAKLHDPEWLREKVVAHEQVVAAALGASSVLPFRFGAIYEDEPRVRRVLRERNDFPETLARLEGTYEWGVKGFLDLDALRERLAQEQGLGAEQPSTGRAYMQRKRIERALDEAAASFAADSADACHSTLSAAALDARSNPAQRVEEDDAVVMFLNGAYLVRRDDANRFADALARLQKELEVDGVRLERTGPWAPYNFVDRADAL